MININKKFTFIALGFFMSNLSADNDSFKKINNEIRACYTQMPCEKMDIVTTKLLNNFLCLRIL